MYLVNIINSKQNNFNLLRLIMALAVLYNHSFVMFQPNGHQDITTYLFHYFDSGSLAVSVFFLISGLLLTQSFYQTKSATLFILKRLLRIFPGLLFCLLVTVFIIGPLVTSETILHYFSSKGTYRYMYNLLLNNEYFFYDIPSCLEGNWKPKIINGSLWTLPFELLCYTFLFLGLMTVQYFKNNKSHFSLKFFNFSLIIFFAILLFNSHYLINRFVGLVTGFLFRVPEVNNSIRLFIFFFIGSSLFFLKEKISIKFSIWAVIIVALTLNTLVIESYYSQQFLEYAAIIYGTLFIAGQRFLFRFNYKTDPSYGIYLYAWPIQQLIAYYFKFNTYQSVLVTIPIVIFLGYFSFVLIEKPAMAYAKKINAMFYSK